MVKKNYVAGEKYAAGDNWVTGDGSKELLTTPGAVFFL